MRKGSRSEMRRRIFSLVALSLTMVVALVAMSAFLQVGRTQVDQRVYAFPYRTLLALAEAENRFRRQDLDLDGRRDFAASFEELEASGCITQRLASGRVRDYDYVLVHADEARWAITASPVPVTSASLFYYIDQTHVVRAERGAPATPESRIYWHPFRGLEWEEP